MAEKSEKKSFGNLMKGPLDSIKKTAKNIKMPEIIAPDIKLSDVKIPLVKDIFKKKDSEDVVDPADKKIDFKKIGKRAAIVGAAGAAILGGIAIGRHHAAKKNNSDEDDRYITVNTTNDSDDETPAEETEPQETDGDSDVTITTF